MKIEINGQKWRVAIWFWQIFELSIVISSSGRFLGQIASLSSQSISKNVCIMCKPWTCQWPTANSCAWHYNAIQYFLLLASNSVQLRPSVANFAACEQQSNFLPSCQNSFLSGFLREKEWALFALWWSAGRQCRLCEWFLSSFSKGLFKALRALFSELKFFHDNILQRQVQIIGLDKCWYNFSF